MVNQPKLNLACGQIRIKDYFGIDIVKMDSVDAVMNLEDFPWDIASDSAEDIICNHYVEHTPMDTHADRLIRAIMNAPDFEYLKRVVPFILQGLNDGLIDFMEEAYRIMKVGGKLHMTCPHYNTGIAWQDPTHRRGITEETFHYFNKGWREHSQLSHYPITCDFEVKFAGYDLFPDMEKKSVDEKLFSSRHLSNFIAHVKFVLIKNPTNHARN